MGTNYYQIIGCCDKCGRGEERIHIGKASAGWPFTVHVIPEIGINSWLDWCSRLESGALIKDEYGTRISLLDLHEIVKTKRAHANEDHVMQSLNDSFNRTRRCIVTGDLLLKGEFC
jgi:hypothetical protein